MSESSDTGQASIVFLGRESFRMQVVADGAIPTAFREGPTERIIERRNWDRRYSRRADDARSLPAVAPASRKKLVIGVSLATFACGLLAATALYRLRPHARTERIAQIERAQPPAATPAPQPPAPASPAVIVAPVANPEPAVVPAPAASEPLAAAPHAEKRLTPPKARPAARNQVAPAPHTRQTAAPVPAAAPAIKAVHDTPSAAPRPKKKWVDPWAD